MGALEEEAEEALVDCGNDHRTQLLISAFSVGPGLVKSETRPTFSISRSGTGRLFWR
jgi:hypothetical protein